MSKEEKKTKKPADPKKEDSPFAPLLSSNALSCARYPMINVIARNFVCALSDSFADKLSCEVSNPVVNVKSLYDAKLDVCLGQMQEENDVYEFNIPANNGSGFIFLSKPLISCVINLLTGGDDKSVYELNDKLSNISRSILDSFIDCVSLSLYSSMSDLFFVEPFDISEATRPFANVQEDCIVLEICFLGKELKIYFSYSFLSPFLHLLKKDPSAVLVDKENARWTQYLDDKVNFSEVELKISLSDRITGIEELKLLLKEKNTVMFSSDKQVALYVNDVNILSGVIGQINDVLAVQIQGEKSVNREVIEFNTSKKDQIKNNDFGVSGHD